MVPCFNLHFKVYQPNQMFSIKYLFTNYCVLCTFKLFAYFHLAICLFSLNDFLIKLNELFT